MLYQCIGVYSKKLNLMQNDRQILEDNIDYLLSPDFNSKFVEMYNKDTIPFSDGERKE